MIGYLARDQVLALLPLLHPTLHGRMVLHHNDVIDEVECHCQVTGIPDLHVDVADTTRWQQQATPVNPIEGIGDISFTSNKKDLAESFQGWTSNSLPRMAPRSFDDVLNEHIMERLKVFAGDQAAMTLAATAFRGSVEEESTPLKEFDNDETELDKATMDVSEDTIQQETELDRVGIPNLLSRKPNIVQDAQLPQKMRIATCRLYRRFGHVLQKVLLNLLRSAFARNTLMQLIKRCRC